MPLKNASQIAGVYEAKGKNADGYFAVQLIDNGEGDDALIKVGTAYNTAIYFQNPNTLKYTIVAGNAVTVAE